MPSSNSRHNDKDSRSLADRRKEEAIAKAWERAKADSEKFDELGVGKTPAPSKSSSGKATTSSSSLKTEKKKAMHSKDAPSNSRASKSTSSKDGAPKNGVAKGAASKGAASKAKATEASAISRSHSSIGAQETKEFAPYKPATANTDSNKRDKKAKKVSRSKKQLDAAATAELPKTYVDDVALNAKVSKAKVGKDGKPKKKLSKKRIAAIVAACFCGVLLCGAGAVALALNLGKANLVEEGDVDVNENAISYDNGQTVEYNGVKYKRKTDMTSILLLGHDGRDGKNLNGQTDLIMVMAIDTNSGKIDIISVPRDTMVDVSRNYNKSDQYADTVRMQIATAFAYGSDFEHSAENVCSTVSQIIYNIPMSYYYVLNVNGIAPLADAVGGVEVQALMNVPPAGIVEGQTYNLTGKKAYYYVQYRNTAISNSAVGRLDRQKQFLNAYAKKVFDEAKGNVGVLVDIFNTVAEYSTTNIGVPEFTYLASIFLNHGVDDFEITTLEGERSYNSSTGYEEMELNRDAVYQTVLDVYYEPLEEAQKAEEEAEEEKSIDHFSDAAY